MGSQNMKMFPFLVEKPWGGQFISKTFNYSPIRTLGEAFLVSTLINNESMIGNQELSRSIKVKLPYLIKVIDAADNLSIQVHPNDYWAGILEKSVGKTECWLVLDADEGAGVYYGFKEGMTFDQMMTAINNGEDASTYLNFIPAKPGDFISVPAGTIHAIGKGVRILEFQQSSGITYRIWDWGREGRELHLDKARKVTNSEVKLPNIFPFELIEVGRVFFEHNDFILKKKSSDSIECYSTKVDVKFEINAKTLECDIS